MRPLFPGTWVPSAKRLRLYCFALSRWILGYVLNQPSTQDDSDNTLFWGQRLASCVPRGHMVQMEVSKKRPRLGFRPSTARLPAAPADHRVFPCVQARASQLVAKSDPAYWGNRLFKNTYTTSKGSVRQTRNWCVKIQHRGIRRTLSLLASQRPQAAAEACQIYCA